MDERKIAEQIGYLVLQMWRLVDANSELRAKLATLAEPKKE